MPINDYKDRPNTIHWPPALYLLTLAAAYLLQRIMPIPTWVPPPYASQIGWPLFVFGVTLGCIAIKPVDTSARRPITRIVSNSVKPRCRHRGQPP